MKRIEKKASKQIKKFAIPGWVKRFLRFRIPVWGVLGIVAVVVAIVIGANVLLFFRGATSTNQKVETRSVVTTLEKIHETAFVSVGFRDVKTAENVTKIPGTNFTIPMTRKRAILIFNYKAKFGIKKAPKVTERREHDYVVEIPKYEVIGFELDDKKPYEEYDSRGELLSYSTQKIDTAKVQTEALSSKEKEKYLTEYKDMITESAESYFRNLITGIDSKAKIQFINRN